MLALIVVTALGHAADAVRMKFNLPAGEAGKTLKQFATQAKREILFASQPTDGVKTNAVQGELTVREGLDRLLAGTDLKVIEDEKTGALVVKGAESPNAPRVAPEPATTRKDQSRVEDGKLVLDKFEVFGSKSINLDVPRSRDDAQPYVVFSHDQIANAQASNLQDFFRTRLPMATQVGQFAYTGGSALNSTINLRGLGFNQTLLLVDGRRLPAFSVGGAISMQPADPNGIPMEMIERIEVLPSTASGIYGGGATGGVINIITRKDFSGAVLTMNYVNTFDTDTARRRVDFNASSSMRGGKTMLTFTASWQDANRLLVRDRDFATRARQLAFANNPALFTAATTPPRGYTTNIRNQNGANLVLKPQYGGVTLSSPITSVPVGYAGIASDNAAALVANAGRYNLGLPDDVTGLKGSQITPATPVMSVGASLRQKLTPWLEGYADFLRTINDTQVATASFPGTATLAATAPNNPFTTAVSVAFPTSGPQLYVNTHNIQRTSRATAGLVAKLPGEWQAALDYAWGRSVNVNRNDAASLGDPDGATGTGISYSTAVATGVLDVMRDLNVRGLDYGPYLMPGTGVDNVGASVNQSITARASGPVFRLPAGEVMLSTSAELLKAKTEPSVFTAFNTFTPEPGYFYTPDVSSTNRSLYAEARVPLWVAREDQKRQPRLELQVAGRYDESEVRTLATNTFPQITSAIGPFPTVTYVSKDLHATTHTVGLRFAPIPDVVLRASAGTGFLAPDMVQLSPGGTIANRTIANLADPKRGGVLTTVGPMDLLTGGSPTLRPEESESYSGGIILTPRVLPGFRLSVDYTRINKTDEIFSNLSFQQALDFEDLIPGSIVRAPLTAADQALGYTGGTVTQMSIRSVNFARREVEALDLQADYTRKLPVGEVRVYAVATKNLRFAGRVIPTAPLLDEVGYSGSPLEWRGNTGVDWNRGHWSAGWNTQYYSAQSLYRISDTAATRAAALLTQGYDTFPAQLYHDAQVSYEFSRGAEGWRRICAGLKVTVGLQNVFNREPPLQAGNVTRSGFQNIEDPRLRRYSLTVRKRF